MAFEDSRNFPFLMNVGALVRFAMKLGVESLTGTVYFLNSDDGSFGIEDVSRKDERGICRKVEGYYQFFLKDVKDLRVLVPGPKPPTTTNTTTKDDKKTNPGDASSSTTAKDRQKTNPGDASASTTAKDDQKSNPGDVSGSTLPSK